MNRIRHYSCTQPNKLPGICEEYLGVWECLALSGCVNKYMDVYQCLCVLQAIFVGVCECACEFYCECACYCAWVTFRYGTSMVTLCVLMPTISFRGHRQQVTTQLQVTYEHIQRKMPMQLFQNKQSAEVNDIKGIEYLTPSRVSALDMVSEEFPSCIDFH